MRRGGSYLKVVLFVLITGLILPLFSAYTWEPTFPDISVTFSGASFTETQTFSANCPFSYIVPDAGNYGPRPYKVIQRAAVPTKECDSLKIYAIVPNDNTEHLLETEDPSDCWSGYETACGDDYAGAIQGAWGNLERTGHHPPVPVLGIKDINWTGIDKICTINGLEGDYNFKLYSEPDNKHGVQPYCSFDPPYISVGLVPPGMSVVVAPYTLTPGSELLEVDWDNDTEWCSNVECGKGEYLEGVTVNQCCSAREMETYNYISYTNEDCTYVNNGMHLCYLSLHPSGEGIVTGNWLNDTNHFGEVIYEGCSDDQSTTNEDGREYLATPAYGWIYCDSDNFYDGSGTSGTSMNTHIVSVTDEDEYEHQVTHEYICAGWRAPHLYTIAECNSHYSNQGDLNRGRSESNNYGGMVSHGGESINLSDNKVYFCNNLSKWETDLDDYDRAGKDGKYCNDAKLPPTSYTSSRTTQNGEDANSLWTGGYCCGETDDWEGSFPSNRYDFNIYNEYYNDDDVNNETPYHLSNYPGACFNGWWQENETFLTIYEDDDNRGWDEESPHEAKEVMVWHGTFQGCAINSLNALTNKENSFLNDGKVQETIECAPSTMSTDIDKPFAGSFNSTNLTQYGFDQIGNVPSGALALCRDSPWGEYTDTDGGINYNVKGTACVDGGNVCFVDYCESDTVLREYYVFKSSADCVVLNENYVCSETCDDGRCTDAPIIDNNDFLLQLKHNPGSSFDGAGTQLIHDNEYCNIKNWSNQGRSFFCSYTEQWVEDQEFLQGDQGRTHLSFIPWVNETAQQAECCESTECWDGAMCVSSVYDTPLVLDSPYKIMNTRDDGFICKNGSWEWIYKKTSWDGVDEGYCLENTQCLVSSAGEHSLTNVYGPLHHEADEIGFILEPRCINNGEFYLDHYCENGTWTSRTKYVGLELYELVDGGTKDYTLYCDSYEKVLNNADYQLIHDFETVANKYFISNPQSGCMSYNGQSVPCANHVCALVTDPNGNSPNIYLGTSINYRLATTTSSGNTVYSYDLGDALGSSLRECDTRQDVFDNFNGCADDVSFNGKKSIVIFTRESFGGNANYLTVLQNLFLDFISTLVEWIARGTFTSGFDYSLFDDLADDLFRDYGGELHQIPNFECSENDGCIDDPASGNFPSHICGERGNPRKIYDLNTLYMSKIGNKNIYGLAEYESTNALNPAIRLYGFMFEGFDEDVCSVFRPYITGYKCKSEGNKKYSVSVAARTPSVEISYQSLVDLTIYPCEQWRFMSTSNRIQ